MQLRRHLEFAVVIIILGVLAWVLHERFEAIQSEARSVQLRMAAESARSNAQLLQLKCPDWADAGCALRALAGLQRARPPAPPGREPQRPLLWSTEPAQQRLIAVATASDLVEPEGARTRWRLHSVGPSQLEIALVGVIDCRFMLRADIGRHTVSVENIETRC